MTSNSHTSAGFTLTELMITLAVAAILAMMAVPSFQGIIRNNQLTTQTNNLIASLMLARGEAVKRGIRVTLKRKGTVAEVWENGWDIFTDHNGNGLLDDNGDTNLCEADEDCLLRTMEALPAGYTLRTGNHFADWVGFRPNGMSIGSGVANAGNDTFRLCSDLADNTVSRKIEVNYNGRAISSTGTVTCP